MLQKDGIPSFTDYKIKFTLIGMVSRSKLQLYLKMITTVKKIKTNRLVNKDNSGTSNGTSGKISRQCSLMLKD